MQFIKPKNKLYSPTKVSITHKFTPTKISHLQQDTTYHTQYQ